MSEQEKKQQRIYDLLNAIVLYMRDIFFTEFCSWKFGMGIIHESYGT